MSFERIANKTEFFGTDIPTSPITWRAKNAVRVYSRIGTVTDFPEYGTQWNYISDTPSSESPDVIGYRFSSPNMNSLRLTENDLPTEFFNHQLMGVDIEKEESIFSFISDWGFPFSPARANPFIFAEYANTGINLRERNKEALTATTVLLSSIYGGQPCLNIDGERSSRIGLPGEAISIEETRLTIAWLQATVAEMHAAIKSEDYSKLSLAPINAASTYPVIVGNEEGTRQPSFAEQVNSLDSVSGSLRAHGLLTSAICNQMLDTIRDDAPWRQCAYEKCGKVFKRRQSDHKKPSVDAIYCRKQHGDNQKKINRRNKIAEDATKFASEGVTEDDAITLLGKKNAPTIREAYRKHRKANPTQ